MSRRRSEHDQRRAPWRWLRVRVPLIAVAVLAISLAVAVGLAYELLLQAGRNDIEVGLAREHERFERSIATLLAETREEDPTADDLTVLKEAVRSYLEANPGTASYWTIVTFEDGLLMTGSDGPP